MSDCCHNSTGLEDLQKRQSGTLKTVLGINAVMFLIILTAALYADSSALLSDSLDNLGDTLTYAFSLYAVSLGLRVKARVALLKGVLILLAAFAVWGQILYKLINPGIPVFELMGIFSILALAGNSVCLALLWRHKSEDVNMSSVWECSRNDILANVSVFVAAGGVWLTNTAWPDLLVAVCIATLFLRSSIRVLVSAHSELQNAR